ncbi:NEW3 domain-containing protein [Halobacteria archaeon AArc-dxtr1]|nr:NEW3 domain-containing protein [Halobacteria archaeon AArc-dxtr1]
MSDEQHEHCEVGEKYRRRFLKGVGAVGATGVFAGCLSDGDDADDTGDDPGDDTGDDTGDDDPADPMEFGVIDVQPGDHTVTRTDPFEATATVENSGGQEGEQDIELRIDGDDISVQSLSLDVGGADQVTFDAVDTEAYDPGNYVYEVATDDDSEDATLTIDAILGDDPDPLIDFDTEVVSVEPGSQTVTATLENPYSVAVEGGDLSLSMPDGWEIADESGTSFDTLDSGATQVVEWELSVPDEPGSEFQLTGTVSYASFGEEADVEFEQAIFISAEAPEGVSYLWEMSDGEGDATTDAVSGTEMTLNGPRWQSGDGVGDHYLEFGEYEELYDGSGDFGAVDYQDDFDGLDAITVNFWLRTDNENPWGPPNVLGVNQEGGTTSPEGLAWLFYQLSGEGDLKFVVSDGEDVSIASVEEPSAYADGAWHMVTGVWDGDAETIQFYLDGELVEEESAVAEMDTVEQELAIGATQGGHMPFADDLDHVEIAPDTVWGPDQIADRYDELEEHYETEPPAPDAPEGVAYQWEVSEGEGDVTVDSVSETEMELEGATWQSDDGVGGHYLEFGDYDDISDGSGDYGSVEYQSDFDGLDAITVNFWIRTDTEPWFGQPNVVGVNAEGGTTSAEDLAWLFYQDHDEGGLDFVVSDGEDESIAGTSAAYADDEWHMVTGVWDGDAETIEFYLDGEQVEEASAVAEMDTVEQELAIGATQGGHMPFDDDLDHVEVAPDTVWDADQIADRYDELQENY